jgi:hypothetical protein
LGDFDTSERRAITSFFDGIHQSTIEIPNRTSPVPAHDSISIGTLRDIADDAGA